MTNTCKALLVAVGLAIFAAPPLFSQSPPADTGGVTMIFASDTQLTWWRSGDDNDCKGCTDSKGMETNGHMVSAMNAIEQLGYWPSTLDRNSNQPVVTPSGVIINGDLTASWQPEDVARYTKLYDAPDFRFQIYPGLGNHDYRNNVSIRPTDPNDHCYYGSFFPDKDRCAKEAVWWMARRVKSLPNVVNDDVPDFVSVLNSGGYLIRFTASWTDGGGQRVSKSTDSYGVGQRRGVVMPKNAGFPLSLRVELFTGVSWLTLHETDDLDAGVSCFWVDGTVFNPGWHTGKCAHSWPTGSAGSLSYSFDIGNVHFVQLQLDPAYATDLPKEDSFADADPEYGLTESPGFTVTSSYDWLNADLFIADAQKKQIVINMHIVEEDPGYSVFTDTSLQQAMAGRNVVAIFGGHLHQDYGVQWDSYANAPSAIDNGLHKIPVFMSGSAECERFLVADFHDRYFNVAVVSAANGKPSWVTSDSDICDPRGDFGGTNYAYNLMNPAPHTFWLNKPPTFVHGSHFGSTVEGGFGLFQAVGTDPDHDPLTFTWNFGDGATATGQQVSHIYGRSGTFNVSVVADDGYGGSLEYDFSLPISNQNPVVSASQVAATDTDTGSIAGSIGDAGSDELHTVSVDWGAGGPPQVISLDARVTNFSATHVYSTAHAPGPQTFQVNLTVADDAGGTGQASLPITVVRGVPPTTIAPLAIGIEPTEAGGARSGNSPVLAAFLARAYAIPGTDPRPVAALPTFRRHFGEIPGVFGGFDIDVPIMFSTLLPLGTTPVHFRYVDRHGLASDAFANVTVGPQPHLTVEPSVVTDASGTWIDLRIRNGGGAAAKNVLIRMVTFRALDAAGLVTLLAPLPPVSVDNLGPGAATDVRARIFISPGVTRFAVNTYAMVTGLAGDVTAVYDVTPASR